MTDSKKITFKYANKDVTYEVGKKADYKHKNLEILFKSIIERDDNKDGKISKDEKKVSQDDYALLKKLQETINKGAKATQLAQDWTKAKKETDMTIETFIDNKLKELEAPVQPQEGGQNNASVSSADQDNSQTPGAQTDATTGENVQTNAGTTSSATTTTPKAHVITQAEKNAQFNKSIQNARRGIDTNALGFRTEVKVTKGKYLYNIAKEALQAEGNQNPTAREINKRIAEIAAVNNINDINNIQLGTKLKVGTGRMAGASAFGRGNDRLSFEGGVTINEPIAPPEGKEWPSEGTEVTNFSAGITLSASENVKHYQIKEGVGENEKVVREKFVYNYTVAESTVTFEAEKKEALEADIKKFQEALNSLTNAPNGEEADAKKTRIETAISSIMSLGTESAVQYAQTKLADLKDDVNPDFYTENTVAMLKSMNPEVFEQILGEENANFAELCKNEPKIQQAIADVYKSLTDKYNNDQYLTLDEQKIWNLLKDPDGVIGKDGVVIELANEVEAREATETTEAVEAKDKVFAKQMVIDRDGNTYYKGKVGGSNETFKEIEFKAKDADTLNKFLLKLEEALKEESGDNAQTVEAKLTELFKNYAETDNADPELMKSIAENASKLNASADDVMKLVNNSNSLDLIYAIDISGFNDEAASDGQQAVNDKTNVQNAINARIQAIMDDQTLAKLPENAKYLDRIPELNITGQTTELTQITDVSDWGEPTATSYVEKEDGTWEVASEANAEGAVIVNVYKKDGQPDVYEVNIANPITGDNVDLSAGTAEEVLKLKKELEALALTEPQIGQTLTDKQKRENLEKLIKIADIRATDEMYKNVAKALKDETLINHDDPDAKALVQKLLLTRDADVVKELTQKEKSDNSGFEADNTLFENDPVALKTLAAMFKEIRDKENKGEKKLSPEEIALKDVLDDCVVKMETVMGENEALRFNGEGDVVYAYNVPDSCKSTANKALLDVYQGGDVSLSIEEVERAIKDPILSKDKQTLASISHVYHFSNLEETEKIDFIKLKAVDAEILSYIDMYEPTENLKEAYVEKAKQLFTFESAEGAKLDPANARYLNTILEKIDSMNEQVGDVDADDTVIGEILANFFITEGEGPNQTVKIKDFRRFTYEEMEGLAAAVAKHGTDAQKAALADMITIEDMEDGQFVRAIEGSDNNAAVRTKYTQIADTLNTKEEVMAFMDKISNPHVHLPFDKIVEKFGDEQEVMNKLLKCIYSNYYPMSENTRQKLVDYLIKDGNVTIPDDVDTHNLVYLLPQEKAADGENPAVTMTDNDKKLFDHLVSNATISDIGMLDSMENKATQSTDYKQKVYNKVKDLVGENATNSDWLLDPVYFFPSEVAEVMVDKNANDLTGVATSAIKAKVFESLLFDNSTKITKDDLIKAYRNGWIVAADESIIPTKFKTDKSSDKIIIIKVDGQNLSVTWAKETNAQ